MTRWGRASGEGGCLGGDKVHNQMPQPASLQAWMQPCNSSVTALVQPASTAWRRAP